MSKTNEARAMALMAILIPLAHADQGSFSNSGGSGSVGSAVYVTSPVASPAGSLSLTCPAGFTGTCAGGSFTYSSNDGTINIKASFTSGKYAEGCAGGGKGGHVTCSYTFTGNFSGTLTVNGSSQAITGVTSQAFGTGGAAAIGTSAYNSAYAPFYYSDSEQILRSDDLQGTNQISFGSQGSGVGQFYGAYGIALDSAGRIYVADTYNCRVVRMDDMNGTNWITYGGDCGSGQGQFYDPAGIAVDSTGKIYVLDSGNCRLVRLDDMAGANWIAYGSCGNGVGGFTSNLNSVTIDASGRIYVADPSNLRIVRMDDMLGTNWTALTQSPVVNGVSYSLQSPVAVALDSTGRIYIADNEGYQPAVVRVDDMTGANWTSIYTGAGGGLNSISVDAGGTVFAGGGGARFVVNMAAVLNSSGSIGPFGSYYVFGITPIPLPSPRPSAISLSPNTLSFSQNVGTTGSQAVTVYNFGGSAMSLGPISAAGGFGESNNCSSQLLPGSNCTVTVSFSPSATGSASGILTITDNAGNLASPQTVMLSGQGTAPAAGVSPASLNFSSQVVNTTSNPRNVVLQNTGTGPMQVSSVTTAAPFSETNTCGSLAPGASCTISVTFSPVAMGAASGTLTIVDDAGTQTVNLSGTGSSPMSFSPNNLEFSTTLVGTTSAPSSITVTNRGSAVISLTSIVASASFAISSNTCGSSLAGGTNCSVGVSFSPTTSGQINGALTFTDNALNSPQTVSLTGNAVAPITISTSSLNFNSVVEGNTGSAKTVTLTNHQTVTLNFSGITASAGFAIASNNCGTSIAAGANCTVGVTFSPTTTGTVNGSLTFTDDAPNNPQTVNLTGTGNAAVSLSASSLNFGTVTVGKTSSAKSVTLTNHLSVSLPFTSIVTGAGFAIASNTCGSSIGGGASCTVGVTFSPAVAGSASGTLTFTDSALNSPQTVKLTGSGQ